ncbi:MAG: hypothetical protein ACYDCN_02025 [Bacteroidia bacterium]
MVRIFLYGLSFALIGFVAGYFIFGKIPIIGDYIPLAMFFGIGDYNNKLVSMVTDYLFLESARQKIYISMAVGAIVGIIIAVMKNFKDDLIQNNKE